MNRLRWVGLGMVMTLVASFLLVAGVSGWIVLGFDLERLKDEYPVWSWDQGASDYVITWKTQKPKHWLRLNEISESLQNAVIVSEDWAFYQHSGIDLLQVRDAVEESFEEGKAVRGASTITQQVIKNVFLSSERSFFRKAVEWILALRIEKVLTKRKILEVYLNIAEWGDGVFGAKRASEVYFQKAAEDIGPKEAAFLAMLLPSPKRYASSFRQKELTRFARRSVQSILKKMVRARFISQDEYEIELDIPLSFERVEPVDDPTLDPSPQDGAIVPSEEEPEQNVL